MKKKSFASLKKSMDEGLQIARGHKFVHAHISQYVVRQPKRYTAAQIKKIRQKTSLSQPVFASILGVSVNAYRNWEQGRNTPSMIACRFLEIIEDDPQGFLDQAENMKIYQQGA